ncbi:hypothetical protein Tco_1103996 [Tanacetum coccineum]
MEECHKMFTNQIDWMNPEGDQVRVDVNQPLPLGGPLGHGSNPALSISKMKAASYPDFGLELLVPEQMWIDDVCTYDISAKYGISHWWFNRQKFYIDRHDSPSRRKDVRTHMRILSVVRIKAYSRYGYDYLSEIVLRRADFQEHTIAEKDFKNLYPSDFEDLNLLLLQGHLDHLPGSDKRMLSTAVKLWTQNLVIRQRVEDFQLGIESYQTQLNLTKPGWDATGYEFKHDYTIIESPRVVVFLVDNNDQKIMRFNEIYKFYDGTLTHILEALDYKVKEFKDVDKEQRVIVLLNGTEDEKESSWNSGMLCWLSCSSYKDGKVRYMFPMIPPELVGVARDISTVSVEVLGDSLVYSTLISGSRIPDALGTSCSSETIAACGFTLDMLDSENKIQS